MTTRADWAQMVAAHSVGRKFRSLGSRILLSVVAKRGIRLAADGRTSLFASNVEEFPFMRLRAFKDVFDFPCVPLCPPRFKFFASTASRLQKKQATLRGEWPVLAKSSGEEGKSITCCS